MDIEVIIESLSPLERKILPLLGKEYQNLEEICKKSGEDETSVARSFALLKKKNLIEERVISRKIADLGILGVNYLKKDLPERVLLNFLQKKRIIPVGEIQSACKLNPNEAKVSIGILKKKGYIRIESGKIHFLHGGDISPKMPEEVLLEKLPLFLEDLNEDEKKILEELKSRKDIVEVKEKKTIESRITNLGEEVLKRGLRDDLIEELTPQMIKNSSWKGKKFRRYDLTAQVPRIYGGKRHFVNQAKDYARSIWIEMGFKEMTGSLTDTSFWVFDALFTAQDHPVREMQDTFFIKGKKGRLPVKTKNDILKGVKLAHEGGIGGSIGWKYEWSEEESKKVLMRTHTTCLSARMLKEIGEKKEYPAKYFSIGKCFRNETVDWSHSFEFNQTEGIVVDKNANFRQLIGYLVEFFRKMGYEKIRIRPAYFAYTEPSLEMDVLHPKHKKWIELGAAGMFRPEVTIPMFGEHIPVLAWGPGFDRIITQFYNINDLRELYKNNLNKLREIKFWSMP